jgi:hypothetical protein
LSFEANVGQADAAVRYLAHGSGYALALTDSGASLRLQPGAAGSPATVLQLELVGSNGTPTVLGLDQQAGHSNYLLGNDPSQRHTGVPLFGRVAYQQVYPGIDLVFYGNDQHQLEYDFVLHPGADPSQIDLRFDGANGLDVDAQGDLVLHLAGGDVVQHAPVVYQVVDGQRRPVTGAFVLQGNGTVGLQLGSYDAGRALVIDPVLTYSTYLGGSGEDQTTGLAVDSTGSVYVTGFTGSSDFPTANPFQPTNSFASIFVTKLNAAGSLVYSTYLGTGQENVGGIAVDAAGNVYLTGDTGETNFPTAGSPVQATFGGGGTFPRDAFVTKLNAEGNALVYSTYLGGSDDDLGLGIAVDAAGNAYVTGVTSSTNFPTANAVQPTFGGGFTNAFVAKLNAAGSALLYSTFLGGNNSERGQGIAVDTSGNAYVTGSTNSVNFPTANAVQPTFGGDGDDAFVTKLNATGSALLYSTFLGGTSVDFGTSIAVDAAGNAYVAGVTLSTNFPTTRGAFQESGGGGFITKLNAAGNALVYSTFLTNDNSANITGIAVDASGNAYVTGITSSTTFPTVSPLQANYAGSLTNDVQHGDAIVAELTATGNALVFATYLGGSDADIGQGIALDGSGNLYVAGSTYSPDFPTVNPLQANLAGAQLVGIGTAVDAFVVRLAVVPSSPLTYTAPTGNGPHDMRLRVNGTNLELLDNGVVVRSQPLATTSAVVITGADDEPDSLTLDNRFGGRFGVPSGIHFDGGQGGGNTLQLLGTTSAPDSLMLTPTLAIFDTTEVTTFTNVQAVTVQGKGQLHGDTAYLFDGPGDDTLLGTLGSVTLRGPGFSNTASGFDRVSAFASTGNDAADLTDTGGLNLFFGLPTYSLLTERTQSLDIIVSGFHSVRVTARVSTPGYPPDVAYLYDSTGADVFVGTPTLSYLSGSGFVNLVLGFAEVHAFASGGADVAFLYDSAGNDVFRGTPTYSFLQGDGFLNLASGFGQVNAYAGAGGSDLADLYDAPGNDLFSGQGSDGILSGMGYHVAVNGFAYVRATSGAGGIDHIVLNAIDYVFQPFGNWQ